MESPEGNFDITKEGYKQLPQDYPKEKKEIPEKVKKWVDEEAEPFLNHYGKKIMSNGEYTKYQLLKWLVIILAVILGAILIIFNGKTDVTCEAQNLSCPAIPTCPLCPSSPNLSCPENVCNLTVNCGNLTFPNKIFIVNGS